MAYSGRRVQELRLLVASTYGLACWLCGRPIASWREYEVDHVLPRALGGSDALPNLRPAHGCFSESKCNTRRGKSTAPPVEHIDDTHWFNDEQMSDTATLP